MKYMGSKNRHAKDILQFVTPVDGQLYIEPFVGGANIIDKIKGERWGCDIDEDLITMWKAVSEGWMPPASFTEEEYNNVKNQQPSPTKGYAAFALSYGGKKFGGWRRDSSGVRNYVDEAYRNALKQFPLLRGVTFTNTSYKHIHAPKGSMIYCDPPYAGTTKYSSNFNHYDFWQWVRKMSSENTVFVSEYNAPDDFEAVWEKKVSSSLTKNTGSKTSIEKLFRLRK